MKRVLITIVLFAILFSKNIFAQNLEIDTVWVKKLTKVVGQGFPLLESIIIFTNRMEKFYSTILKAMNLLES